MPTPLFVSLLTATAIVCMSTVAAVSVEQPPPQQPASQEGIISAPPTSDRELATHRLYGGLWEQYAMRLTPRHRKAAQQSLIVRGVRAAARHNVPAIVTLPAAPSRGPHSDAMLSYTLHARYGVTGRLATVANPIGHWHVYSIDSKEGTCRGALSLTSATAKTYNCTYATNGGPFNTRPDTATRCMGAVVTDGVVTNNIPLPSGMAAFGLTRDGQWSMGYGLNTTFWGAFEQLVTAFGWLVYDGTVVTELPADTKIGGPTLSPTEVAPRTVIGVNAKGELLSFVAEGSETALSGLTLSQAAEWAVNLGMLHAINLDGGGSSVSWWLGNQGNNITGTQGCPTCIDIPFCCERSVETITCVK